MTKLVNEIKKEIKKLKKYQSKKEKPGEFEIDSIWTDTANGYLYGFTIKVKTPLLLRIWVLITNPIVYLFTGKVRW